LYLHFLPLFREFSFNLYQRLRQFNGFKIAQVSALDVRFYVGWIMLKK